MTPADVTEVPPWSAESVDPDELRAVLNSARLAPSLHNTQPWKFVVTGRGIELHGDETRLLNQIDPDGRELTISCGAAILNMRVAAATFCRPLYIALLPDPADVFHLATLCFGPRARLPLPEAVLSEAIERRHTHRCSFGVGRIPAPTVTALSTHACREGGFLVHLDDRQRRGAARLTAIAEMAFAADPAYRRELRAWTSRLAGCVEGVPATGFGTRPIAEGMPPLRDFTVATSGFQRPTEVFADDDWFVLLTETDNRAAWIAAGEALERVLLVATDAGLGVSFMTQAMEEPECRAQLAAYLETDASPQVLLRMGAAVPTVAAGRRPLEQVVSVRPDAAGLFLDR
jgi:hypothetical protein